MMHASQYFIVFLLAVVLSLGGTQLVPAKTPTLYFPHMCQRLNFLGFYGINLVSQSTDTYAANYQCIVTVTLSRNYYANLTFTRFELEPPSNGVCNDYLQIYQGRSADGPQITGQVCGSVPPFHNFIANTSEITVIFKTNHVNERQGFRLEIRRAQKLHNSGGSSGLSGGSSGGSGVTMPYGGGGVYNTAASPLEATPWTKWTTVTLLLASRLSDSLSR